MATPILNFKIEDYMEEAKRTKQMWEQISKKALIRDQNKAQSFIQSTPQGNGENNMFQQSFIEEANDISPRLEKHPEQVIEEIFHWHKELYAQMKLDADSSMVGTIDMILHIVKEYYEPTPKDNSIKEINRILGFTKPPNHQVDIKSNEIPF